MYFGVLVDDLCILGIKELYRMFISCVEYRLMLCEDNVDLCLIEIGRELGLVDDECWVCFNEKFENIECECQCLKSIWVILSVEVVVEVNVYLIVSFFCEVSGEDLLCRLEMIYEKLIMLMLFVFVLIDE